MAASSTPQGSLRHRNVAGSSNPKKKDGASSDSDLDTIIKAKTLTAKKTTGSQREYQITAVLITALAFLTRFWGISHPDEVVFDEVHFGKVCLLPDNSVHQLGFFVLLSCPLLF